MSPIVTAFGALGILLADRNRGPISAFLFGLSMAIKAPVALAFLMPDLIARRWKFLTITVACAAIITAVGIARLGNPSKSTANWLDNLHAASAAGGVNDPSPANPYRGQLLNLQYPLSTSISDPRIVNAIALAVAAVLVIPSLLRLRDKPTGTALLLPLGCLCVIQLIVGYHRMYDATLLVFPLAYALLPTTPRWQAWPILLLILVLVLPGSGPLVNASAARQWWWDRFILPRDAYATFLLGGWLACCQLGSTRIFGRVAGDESVSRKDPGVGRVSPAMK
jgi:hypothetical protein